MYDDQLVRLEALIETQQRCQKRMRAVVSAVEKQFHLVSKEVVGSYKRLQSCLFLNFRHIMFQHFSLSSFFLFPFLLT